MYVIDPTLTLKQVKNMVSREFCLKTILEKERVDRKIEKMFREAFAK